MYMPKPYSNCTPGEIASRMSPVLKGKLLNLLDATLPWGRMHGRDRAALVDRTLVTSEGHLTETGHQVATVIRTERAATMEAKYQ